MLIICGTALRWHEHVSGFYVKHGNLRDDENRKSTSRRKTRLKVEMCPCRGGATRSSKEVVVMITEQRGGII